MACSPHGAAIFESTSSPTHGLMPGRVGSSSSYFTKPRYLPGLALIRLRPRYREHKGRQFVGVQLAIVIPIRPRELHLQEPKHVTLRDVFACRNRSHVILYCHENLRPQKGPHISWANHAIAVSWTAIIAPRRIKFEERCTEPSMRLIVPNRRRAGRWLTVLWLTAYCVPEMGGWSRCRARSRPAPAAYRGFVARRATRPRPARRANPQERLRKMIHC